MRINPIGPVSTSPTTSAPQTPPQLRRLRPPLNEVPRLPAYPPQKKEMWEKVAAKASSWVGKQASKFKDKTVMIVEKSFVKSTAFITKKLPVIAAKVGGAVAKGASKTSVVANIVIKSPLSKIFGPVGTVIKGIHEIAVSDNKAKTACQVVGETIGTGVAVAASVLAGVAPPAALAIYVVGTVVLGSLGRELGTYVYDALTGPKDPPKALQPKPLDPLAVSIRDSGCFEKVVFDRKTLIHFNNECIGQHFPEGLTFEAVKLNAAVIKERVTHGEALGIQK